MAPPKPSKPSADLERARFKLTRALVELTCSHAFHASLIMRLERREDTTLPFPMATDGVRLLVNLDMLDQFNVAELTYILCHEAQHVAGRHMLRQEWRTDMAMTADGTPISLWNIEIGRAHV